MNSHQQFDGSIQDVTRHIQALLRESHFEEAERVARRFLDQQPEAAGVWQQLGMSLSAQNKEALYAFEKAVQLKPNDVNAHINFGIALLDAGRIETALHSFERALSIQPNSVSALNHVAATLSSVGRYNEALICYQRVVSLKPQQVKAHRNLANAFFGAGRFHEAIASYQRVLEMLPADYEANLNIGNSFRAVQKLEDALRHFQRALEARQDAAASHIGVATVLRLQGKADKAEQYCRDTVARYPGNARLQAVLGQALSDLGRFEEAEEVFMALIDKEPQLLEAWDGIAHLRKMTIADAPLWERAEAIATQLVRPQDELFLRYSIAKYHDDTGNYERAFNNYRRANELSKLTRPPHSRQALTRSGDLIINTCNRDWLEKNRNEDSRTSQPVFVVGMMRSGTTLAEQILAAHPAVYGAGELGFWNAAFEQYNAAEFQGEFARQAIEKVAVDHAALLASMSIDAERVVDKTPVNFVCLGFIHAVLPNARIIHMTRDPIDTCLSIYFQNFESTIRYANDLEDLAHCYREYRRLMSHWRSVLPEGVMLEVPYEALVEDTEVWSRKMVEFVGLDWHPDCLQFHNSGRTVVTASKWQVRQKIYKSSMQRWRNYEQFIGPLLGFMDST